MKSRWLGQMFRRVGDYLDTPDKKQKTRKKEVAPEVLPEPKPAPVAPIKDRLLTNENFRDRLEDIKEKKNLSENSLVTGAIELLGLSAVKKKLGDQWPMLQEVAQKVTEETIEKHTSANDLVLRLNDENYVILFFEMSADEAHLRARQIAYEIAEQLYVGSAPEVAELVSVRGMAFEIEPEESIERIENVAQFITYIAAGRNTEEQKEKAKINKVKRKFGLAYRPTVAPAKRMISMYVATPIKTDKEGATKFGRNAYPDDRSGGLTAEMDRYVLEEIGEVLKETGGLHRKPIILVPLHLETLTVPRFRDPYVEVFKRMDHATTRRVMIQLLDVPPGIPQGRMRNLLTTVFPFVLGFICRVERDHLDGYDFGQTGIKVVSIDSEGVDRPTQSVLRTLTDFSKAARKRNLKTLFVGISHPDIASAAASMNYTYINGNALAGLVPKPARAYSID